MKLSEIRENPKNPRLIKDENFQKLVRSIQEFPEMLEARPIVVNPDNIVLGGNMRLKACKAAGLTEAPVYVASWQESKANAFIIKDNVGYGEWDWDILANEWDAAELEEWGLDVWQPDEEPTEGFTDPDEVPEAPEEPKTKLGDLYILGEHRLLCGDSTKAEDVEKLMNGEKADMVFTDPPWNVNYGSIKEGNAQGYKPRTIMNDHMTTESFKDFMAMAFEQMATHSKKGCPTYVVMSAQEWGNLMLCLFENKYHWSSTIIWNKNRLVLSRKDYHTKYEPIWYGWLDGAPRLKQLKDRSQSDVWDFDRPSVSELHPTTKPVDLIIKAIENSSNKDDLLIEPFLGSGSTMIACEKTNRKCYGMELDPKYCDVIVKRWEDFTGKKAIKENL
jgi:DNA modification methylase